MHYLLTHLDDAWALTIVHLRLSLVPVLGAMETAGIRVDTYRLAEIAGEYLRKGRPVFIEGRLQMDSWDDKQTGQKRTKLRVVGESMQLLGSRPGGAGGETAEEDRAGTSGGSKSAAPPKSAKPAEREDDEIPF